MTFKDLELKIAYDSDEDDVLNDFYIPVLSHARKYYRLAGFFSSSILALAAEGLAPFITNDGKMELIIGAVLNQEDIEAIKNGLNDPKQIITENILRNIESIKDTFLLDHLKALSWMIANGNLKIKIAIPLDANNFPLSIEDAKKRGIFHQKVGLLVDKEGNKISFSGSINESAYGWLNNIEEFKVFRSWINREKEYLISDENKMNKYFEDRAINTLIFNIPDAIKNKLISIAPKNWDENILKKYIKIKPNIYMTHKKITLWPPQKTAIENWIKNGYKGILAMATGSGKTFAALSAANLAPLSMITLIFVPTRTLLYQWEKEIKKFDFDAEIILCSGEQSWRKILQLTLASFRSEKIQSKLRKRVYVVATIHAASSNGFLLSFKGISRDNIQIICDEVHHLGAPTFQKCMEISSSRRIGLSATPERQWDFEGTMKIMEYFEKTVFEYDIKDAIKDDYLAKYKYYPYFAYLDDEEFENYKIHTYEINRIIAIINSKSKTRGNNLMIDHKTPKLERLLRERAIIKKKAKDKIRVFREVFKKVDERPLIVYCEDNEQLDDIRTELKGENVLMYTSEMSTWQQEKTLKLFKKGDVEILLAIRCLDEGLDVPECKGCIVLASSSSTREYIQRRGRILRGQVKKLAIMNDIIVLPASIRTITEQNVAKQLVRQEMIRMKQLVDASENEWEARNLIRMELEKYGLEHLAFL